MTVKEAIDAIDLLKPNQFDEQMKTAWISQAEALVQNEVLSYHKEEELVPAIYHYPQDAGTVLLVPEPYSDLYEKYLAAQIDFANAEFGRYNNDMMLFNTLYAAFQNDYRQKHLPKQGHSLNHIGG